ncbi:MAG: hypothetical protein ACK5V6_11285 [Pseudanabaena sp.]|jgi:hypothetical protein
MTKATQGQAQSIFYPTNTHIFVGNSLMVALTVLLVYLIYLCHSKIIPSLQSLDNKAFRKNNNRPQLSPDQESKIKGYMREMLAVTSFNRVSLYFLDSPYLCNGSVQAESYTLWIEASKTIPMRKDTKLSFAYVSEELNRAIEARTKYKYYQYAKDGLVCQVWLRDRKTASYTFYIIHKFSFLLLERTSVSNILTNLLRHKEKDDYLNLCESIESIIVPKLSPIGRL